MSNDEPESKDWIIRCQDGTNFRNSKIYGLGSTSAHGKHFLRNYENGDRLWFLTNKKGGQKFIAVASITGICDRIKGPLLEQTNADIGWSEGDWGDKELHYNNCYLIDELNLQPGKLPINSFILYNPSKCNIKDLHLEYQNICKYSVCKKR